MAKVTTDTLLSFTATASPTTTGLIPYYRMHGERYSVYWTLTNVPSDTFITATAPSTAKVLLPFSHAPELKLTKSQIQLSFPNAFSENQSVDIRLFSLNGVRIAQVKGSLYAGELHTSFMLPNAVVTG